jgi:hypothetical protein
MNYTSFNNTYSEYNDQPRSINDTEAIIIIAITLLLLVSWTFCCTQKSDTEHSVERAKIRLEYRYSV